MIAMTSLALFLALLGIGTLARKAFGLLRDASAGAVHAVPTSSN